jgi:RimJ/RimL family protein N-acetyltransferase
MDWGFARFGWPRIYACVAQANTKVVGLVERLGLQLLWERTHFIDDVQRIYSRERP